MRTIKNFSFQSIDIIPADVISVILITLFLFAAGSIIIYTIKNGISPMPTSPRIKKIIVKIISDLDFDGKIYELGSGWGTLAFPMAGKKKKSFVYAYENSTIPFISTKLINKIFHYNNLKIRKKDFYNISLKNADIVVCYLHTRGMEKLQLKFNKELRDGTIVISNTFAVPKWKPERIIQTRDIYRSKVYIYRVGKNTVFSV